MDDINWSALSSPLCLSLIAVIYLCLGQAIVEWGKQHTPGVKIPVWKRLALLVGWLPFGLALLVADPFRKRPAKHAPEDCPKADQGAGEKAADEEPTKPL